MTYTDFAEKMLIALYQESENNSATYVRFRHLVEKYGLTSNERWLQRLADEWGAEGLAEVHGHLGSPLEWGVEISGRGMRSVEGRYGDKDGVGELLSPIDKPPRNALLSETGEPLMTEGGDYLVSEEPITDQAAGIPTAVSSEAWTGIERRLRRDPSNVQRIKEHILQLDQEVEHLALSNRERAKAKAITEALLKLVESPEPEWKVIVELLRSPTLAAILGVAGIAQLALKIVFGIG